MWANWIRSVPPTSRTPYRRRPAVLGQTRRPRLDPLEDRTAPAAFQLGSTGADIAHATATDAAGHLYIVGAFHGTVDFDPSPTGSFNLSSPDGTADGFIAKYTAAGSLVWAGQLVNSGASAVAVDPAGAVYVTGSFGGLTDFDLGPNLSNLTTGPMHSAFVAKYNLDRSLVWARSFGGQTAGVGGNHIALDAAGNVYSSGVLSNGSADMDPGPGSVPIFNNSGNANSYVSKLDPAGNFVWARQFENDRTIAAGVWTTGLGADAAQNVYISGTFVGAVDFDPGPGTRWIAEAGNGGGDGYVVKLNHLGDFSYVVPMGSPLGRDDADDIAVDSAGNAYVTGQFNNTMTVFDTAASGASLTSAGNSDVLVLKLTPTGALGWARRIGGGGFDGGQAVILDGTSNLYLSGNFNGTVDFDPNGGVRDLTGGGGFLDVFALRLRTDATFVGAWALGGNDFELGNDVALTSDGQVAVVGRFQGTGDFDPGPGTANLTSAGGDDAYVAVFSQGANRPPVASNGTLTTNEDTAANGTLAATDPDGDPLTYALVNTANAHGTVTITNPATGAYTYTPAANYFGPASFTFKASDATLDSNTATVSITVSPVNDAPVAVNDSYSVDEDPPGGFPVAAPGVLGNDTDVEGNPLTAVLVAGPANGTVTLNPNGSFNYRPPFDFNGTDTFTYKARDSAGAESNVATVTITVRPVNDAPRPTPTVTKVTTNEDTATGGQLKATDPDGDAFTFSSPPEFAPQHGTVVVNANGTWTYTPNANFYTASKAPDVFGYKVTDVHGAEGIGIVEITITPVNDAPTAVNDTYSVNEDGTLVVGDGSPVSRLRMISDPGDFVGQGLIWDFNPSTAGFSARTNFDNGVEVLVDPPGISEQWRLNFAAIDSVPLTPGMYLNATRWPFQEPTEPGLDVSGYGRGLNRLKGEFTVYDVGYSPTGGVTRFAATFVQQDHNFDDTLEPPLYGAIVFNSTFGAGRGILTNDTDVEGELLLGARLVTSPIHGDLAFNEDGSFVYRPFPNFHGTDSFTYRTADARDDSNVATVTINVAGVNDPPVANNGSGTTDEDTALNGAVTASDVDGDTLTFGVVAGPAHGTLTSFNAATGAFTYAPAANYNGPDSFTFKANDGRADSNTATFAITVTPVNDAPVANNGSDTTDEDTPLNGALTASDVDGDPLTFRRIAGPASGTVVVNLDGTFTYTPAANFHGTDSFTFKANDGTVDSNTATMTVTIGAVNDNPVANDDSAATDEDSAVTINVLANDTDVDGDALTVSAVTQPAHGVVVINADNTVTYTPAANYNGTDTFTYTAADGKGGTDTATVSLTVRPVNDAPVAVNDSAATDEEAPVTVDVIANDTDVDGDPLRPVLVVGPAHGAVVLNADGTFTYTPAANYNGPDAFTYQATDGTLTSNTATVSLTVRPVNDAPAAVDDSYAADQDTPLNVPAAGVLTNDADVDGDPLSAVLVSGPANGTLTLSPDGSFRYVPNTGFVGPDAFTYKANDGRLDSDPATVTIRVEPAGSTAGKVTGAGRTDNGRKRFNVNVQSNANRRGELKFTGSLTFNDLDRRVRLASTVIHSFRVDDTGTRAVVTGAAKVNGRAGYTFTLIVQDLGERGVGQDTFRLLISGPNGFAYDSLEGVLTSGNLQVRRKP